MISLIKQIPKVSVIVPYYNMGEYIDSLLESLDSQVFRNFEIILVNDGSDESASLQKLEEVEKSRQEIKIINQKNKGLPGARNAGISKAKGKYVCCIDPDDKYHAEYLKRVSDYLDSNLDITIVTSWMKTFGDKISLLELQDTEFPLMLCENSIHVASAFRRSLWKNVGGYDEKMRNGYEDWEFWINCIANGAKVHVIPEPLFFYRVSSSSMLHTLRKDVTKVLDNLNYIYLKHKSLYKKYAVEVISRRDQEIQYLKSTIETLTKS